MWGGGSYSRTIREPLGCGENRSYKINSARSKTIQGDGHYGLETFDEWLIGHTSSPEHRYLGRQYSVSMLYFRGSLAISLPLH